MTWLVVLPHRETLCKVQLCGPDCVVPKGTPIWTMDQKMMHLFLTRGQKTLANAYIGGTFEGKGAIYNMPVADCEGLLSSVIGLSDRKHNEALNQSRDSAQSALGVVTVLGAIAGLVLKVIMLLTAFVGFLLAIPLMFGGRK